MLESVCCCGYSHNEVHLGAHTISTTYLCLVTWGFRYVAVCCEPTFGTYKHANCGHLSIGTTQFCVSNIYLNYDLFIKR